MPLNLVAKEFSEAMLPELAAFSCGDTQFGKLATDWILCRSDRCARTSIEKGTRVPIYFLNDEPVAFGSIGPTPRSVNGVQPLGMIPQVGVDIRFQKFPPDAEWPERLSTAIMLDLLARAREQGHAGVVLQVHTGNPAARKLYDRIGFVREKEPDGRGYQLMFIKLP